MIATLTFQMKQALTDYEKMVGENAKTGRQEFVKTRYGQIVACIA
jgi:hypothetical protein